MQDNEEFDLEEFDGLKPGDTSQLPFPWWQKLLLKISPALFFRFAARQNGFSAELLDHAEALFGGKKIHIQPLSGADGRGFIITLVFAPSRQESVCLLISKQYF